MDEGAAAMDQSAAADVACSADLWKAAEDASDGAYVTAAKARHAPWQAVPTDPTDATVSAKGLAKARGTVEDFARSYLPLLGLPIDDARRRAGSVSTPRRQARSCADASPRRRRNEWDRGGVGATPRWRVGVREL